MAASDSKILGIMLSALLFLYTFYECVGEEKREKYRQKITSFQAASAIYWKGNKHININHTNMYASV